MDETQKWLALIMGDILLVLAVVTAIRRAVVGVIESVMKESMVEVNQHLTRTDAKVDAIQTRMARRDAQVGEMAQTVAQVAYQVRPNKGGSLRDSVERTEASVRDTRAELGERIEKVDNRLDAAVTDIAVLRSKLEG